MLSRLVTAFLLGIVFAAVCPAENPDPALRAVKAEERAAGIKPRRTFARLNGRAAYYRCYYTGKLELPASYDDLKLKKGSKDGCPVDASKYDVFFYPAEAVATRHSPMTRSLAAAPVERVVTVVPHEDFHLQLGSLPDELAEAGATLVGFLAGAAAGESVGAPALGSEADLFLRKAELINRYYERLGSVYQSFRERTVSKTNAFLEKQHLLSALAHECRAIQPAPRTFDRCVSAPNNAGLAFDYTYTHYYPMLHRVYEECGRNLHCVVSVIDRAPRKLSEAVEYFQKAVDERP
jgi:hypothetical protein